MISVMSENPKRRLFIALPVPHEIQCSMHEALTMVREKFSDLRFEPPEKLHLTIKFLGWTDKNASDIAEKLMPIARRTPIIPLQTTTLGAFAGTRIVAFIGLQPYQPLIELAVKIDDAMVSAGFQEESRSFHPHITLARRTGKTYAHWRETARQIKKFPVTDTIRFSADRLALMESTLTPRGSVYQTIKTLRFMTIEKKCVTDVDSCLTKTGT